MASVLDLIKHYQKSIEKYSDDEQRILKSINKLFDLDVKVHHLQETGVGRTVNSLRKEPGKVGQAARALVYKWKCMVAAEESDQEGDYANDTTTYNGHGNEKPSYDAGEQTENSYKNEEEHLPTKQTTDDYSQMNGSYSGSKRKYDTEPDDVTELRKSRSSSNDRHSHNVRHEVRVKPEPRDHRHSSSDQSSESDSDYSDNDSPKKEVSIKKEKTEAVIKHESHKHHSTTSSSSKTSHHTKSSKESHSSESKHSKTSKEKSHSSKKHKSSKDKESSSEKHKSSEEKENSSEKKHKSSKSSEKEKRKHESDSKKHSGDDKHKSSSSKISSETILEKNKDTETHQRSSDKHSTKPEKHSSSSHSSKSDKNKNNEKESLQSDTERPIKHYRSSSKDKHSSSNTGKAHKSSSKDKISDSYKSEKNSKSESKSKSSSGSVEKKSSSSKESRTKEEVPKKKRKTTNNEGGDDGIDCGSGASFAEALGMLSPAKPKKKSSLKSSSSPNAITYSNDLSPAAMLAPTAKLAPLPAIEISALPEISPNYRPLPPPKLLPHFNDEEAMSHVLSSKNQRTKVYSGNKVWGKVPSLYEMCVHVLQEHIDALEYTGGVPYEILKPVVDRATPQQLYMLEHFNPYLMEDTDHLWQKFCEKSFRNKKRQELETWREMYMRCQEEQESKLKSLTANIKSAQEAKRAPIKQTKMAYVDSVVKPPRNIARKQAQHGTAFASTASPAARVAALAAAPNVLRTGSVRAPNAPSASLASLHKPKKAPLMQKALQFMRGRKR